MAEQHLKEQPIFNITSHPVHSIEKSFSKFTSSPETNVVSVNQSPNQIDRHPVIAEAEAEMFNGDIADENVLDRALPDTNGRHMYALLNNTNQEFPGRSDTGKEQAVDILNVVYEAKRVMTACSP